MVRDIVNLMGGNIQVASTLGEGSTFTVTIPEQKEVHLQQSTTVAAVTTLHVESLKDEKAKLIAPILNSAPKEGRILVVDDNEMNCELLRDLLSEEGYEVSTALGGEEALSAARNQHPDLVLLDMMMPYVSGEDVIKAMQDDPQLEDIPVILITARASEDDRLFGLSLGADDYLAKPIHHEELLFRVKNILHRLEINHKVAAQEEQEKMAQLGQLMRELSHELKNVFQTESSNDTEDQQACHKILSHLPVPNPLWNKAAELISLEQTLPTNQVQLGALPFPSKELGQSAALRLIRVTLAQLELEENHRQALWREILNLTPEQQQECQHAIRVVRNFLVMQEQTRYASDLIVNILEYSRQGSAGDSAELVESIQRVAKMIKPRTHRLGIRIELDLQPWRLRINPGQLMQVTLNLLTNACDAVEGLTESERWISIQSRIADQKPVLSFSNGGPALSPDIAAAIFQTTWSSKGKKGYGLGLGISQRIAQRAHGSIQLNKDAKSPQFDVHLEFIEKLSSEKVA